MALINRRGFLITTVMALPLWAWLKCAECHYRCDEEQDGSPVESATSEPFKLACMGTAERRLPASQPQQSRSLNWQSTVWVVMLRPSNSYLMVWVCLILICLRC